MTRLVNSLDRGQVLSESFWWAGECVEVWREWSDVGKENTKQESHANELEPCGTRCTEGRVSQCSKVCSGRSLSAYGRGKGEGVGLLGVVLGSWECEGLRE